MPTTSCDSEETNFIRSDGIATKGGLTFLRSDLTFDEHKRVRWVLDWIERMARKYGGTVYEKNGKRWDWGQALCRECYGLDWMNKVPETPTWDDIACADRWEKGEIPEWVDTILTQKEEA